MPIAVSSSGGSGGSGESSAGSQIPVVAVPSLIDPVAQSLLPGANIEPLVIENVGGGALTNCSSELLPEGLNVRIPSNSEACEIVGAPIGLQDAILYTVTATNVSGTDPCVENRTCLSPWIIDIADQASFPDALPLIAVDENGAGL